MSRENVETVRRVFDAGARRDTAALLALYDPEVEMDVSRSPYVSQGRHHGLEAVRAAFRNWYDAFENVETDVDELIDAGEQVISVITYRGSESGIEVEWKHMAGLWTMRGGKVVRVARLRTREDALEAAGLRE